MKKFYNNHKYLIIILFIYFVIFFLSFAFWYETNWGFFNNYNKIDTKIKDFSDDSSIELVGEALGNWNMGKEKRDFRKLEVEIIRALKKTYNILVEHGTIEVYNVNRKENSDAYAKLLESSAEYLLKNPTAADNSSIIEESVNRYEEIKDLQNDSCYLNEMRSPKFTVISIITSFGERREAYFFIDYMFDPYKAFSTVNPQDWFEIARIFHIAGSGELIPIYLNKLLLIETIEKYHNFALILYKLYTEQFGKAVSDLVSNIESIKKETIENTIENFDNIDDNKNVSNLKEKEIKFTEFKKLFYNFFSKFYDIRDADNFSENLKKQQKDKNFTFKDVFGKTIKEFDDIKEKIENNEKSKKD